MEEKEIIEEWRPVRECPKWYDVSSIGRVRSKNKMVNGHGGKKKKKGKVLTLFFRGDYLSVGLSFDGRVKYRTVHRLMAIAFINNPLKKKTVNHKNGIKTDNYLSNLEWATGSEQILHAIKTGLFVPKIPMIGKFGKNHNKSKGVEQLTMDGKLIAKFGSGLEAERRSGFRQTGISKVCRGEMDSHKGFKWRFSNSQHKQTNV